MAFNFNPNNNANVTGRLARDPKTFKNKGDGSSTVFITVMADRTYKNDDGTTPADAVPLQAWVKPGQDVSATVYGLMHKGDLVKVDYAIRQGKPFEKNGETVYPAPQLAPEYVTLLEPKSVTSTRLAKRVADAEAQNQAVAPGPVATSGPVEQAPAQTQTPAVVGGGFAGDDQPPF